MNQSLREEILSLFGDINCPDKEWFAGEVVSIIEKRIDSKIKSRMNEPVFYDTTYSGIELRHLLILELEELKKELLKK